jgi:transposase
MRVVRTYWRQRGDHVHAVSTCIQRMQKALTQMNIQLANVISDLSGWSGQRIVRALLAGERDPQTLAALSHPGIHATRDTIAKSLEGTWQPDLLFAATNASNPNWMIRTRPYRSATVPAGKSSDARTSRVHRNPLQPQH